MDVQFFAVLVVAVLLSGISKGGFGGSMAFVGSAILALILPPAQAVGIMLPLLMLMDVVTVGPFWRKWDTHRLKNRIRHFMSAAFWRRVLNSYKNSKSGRS